MELSGRTVFRVPQDRLAAALRDPEVLRRMVPACTGVTQLSPTEYEARIEKTAGPMTVRMTARISVEPLDGNRYLLRAKGRNALAGSVEAVLTLTLAPAPGGTSLGHAGHLTATGLAARLLSGREAMLAERTDGMFRQLREAIEAAPSGPA
jgi:carbon monoxide dehydrogenase subunit G